MPQFPKPFFVKARGVWRVQIAGKQHNLGSDREKAFRRYHELMQAPKTVVAELVVGVIDGFLDWCQRHRANEPMKAIFGTFNGSFNSCPTRRQWQ